MKIEIKVANIPSDPYIFVKTPPVFFILFFRDS
jgi:hypothetical protein